MTILRDALWSALTYAVAIAIGAAALRAMAIPRLIGPGAADARVLPLGRVPRRVAGAPPRLRLVWQTVLLAVLGIVVVAWNLLLRA